MIEKLRKGAYWRVRFGPHLVKGEFLSLSECRELVETCQVRLRGWPFSFFRPENLDESDGCIQYAHARKTHKEWWRLDRSGRFEHYASLHEDDPLSREEFFDALDMLLDETAERDWDNYSGTAGISSLLHTITEYFTFLSGYVRQLPKQIDKFSVEIGLHGVRGRVLVETDIEKKWNIIYKTALNEIKSPEEVFTRQELLENADRLTLDTAIHFFENFNWPEPDREQLKEEQQRFFREPIRY
ncbi:MAG TPA: hypothetical protein ENN79_12820 [Desulfobacteraceae bacterium]|nr:hypothetical protein [Desulfobacteraceae bacterium]